jgi:hypothetical protein
VGTSVGGAGLSAACRGRSERGGMGDASWKGGALTGRGRASKLVRFDWSAEAATWGFREGEAVWGQARVRESRGVSPRVGKVLGFLVRVGWTGTGGWDPVGMLVEMGQNCAFLFLSIFCRIANFGVPCCALACYKLSFLRGYVITNLHSLSKRELIRFGARSNGIS